MDSVSIHAPRAGRDQAAGMCSTSIRRFNPRAPRGARRGCGGSSPPRSIVSIHAPRAGRDYAYKAPGCREWFQSTRPARGATGYPSPRREAGKGFNPRAPRGARRVLPDSARLAECFNPRAPRGARLLLLRVQLADLGFQSTRPARGATRPGQQSGCIAGVSIHAPRAGRDCRRLRGSTRSDCFNPRAPRGARCEPRQALQ